MTQLKFVFPIPPISPPVRGTKSQLVLLRNSNRQKQGGISRVRPHGHDRLNRVESRVLPKTNLGVSPRIAL